MTKYPQSFEPMDGRLAAVLEALPADIVSGKGIQRILACVRQMPRCALESTFGFESHLDDAAPYCDLFLSAPRQSRLLHYLAEHELDMGRSPARGSLSRVAKQMWDSHGALNARAHCLILEYDLVVARWSESRVPGIFIARSDDSATRRDVQIFGHAAAIQEAQFIGSLFSWLDGGQKPTKHQEAITDALRALPAGSRVLHVGNMPDRTPQAVRLVLSLPSSEVLRYLQSIDWGGHLPELTDLLRRVGEWCGGKTVTLSLDVSHRGIANQLGLELYRPQPWHSVPAQSWEACLRHFVGVGWACKEKAAGLLNWPRTDWIVSEDGGYKLLTGINHLKLTLENGRVRSKAYMGAFVFGQ